MEDYNELTDIIFSKVNKKEDMIRYKMIMEELMTKLETDNPKLYDCTIYKLEELAYDIPFEKATEIVHNMKPFGEHWDYEQIENYLESKDNMNDKKYYYLVMNMMYNDYCDVAINYNLKDDVNFFYELSYAFINDIDAKDFKVEKYFS